MNTEEREPSLPTPEAAERPETPEATPEAVEASSSPETPAEAVSEAEAAVVDLKSDGIEAATKLAQRLDTPLDNEVQGDLSAIAVEAEAAQTDLTTELTEQPKIEQTANLESESKRKKHKVEWRDAKGEIIGGAEYETEDEEIEDGEVMSVVKALFITGKDPNRPYDVLASDYAKKAGVGRIIVRGGGDPTNGFYSPQLNVVGIESLDSPVGVAVLFHELGHAQQEQEANYKEIGKESGRMPSTEDIKRMRDLFPDMAEAVTDEVIEEWRTSDKQREKCSTSMLDAVQRITAYKRQADDAQRQLDQLVEASVGGQPVNEAEQSRLSAVLVEAKVQVEAANADWKRADEENVRLVNLQDAVSFLPRKVMERDATRRSLLEMHRLRQDDGIDYLSPNLAAQGVGQDGDERVSHEPVDGDRVESCGESMISGLASDNVEPATTTIVKELRGMLKSYDADRPRSRLLEGTDADQSIME